MYTMARQLKEKVAISSKPVWHLRRSPQQFLLKKIQWPSSNSLKMLDAGLITQDEYDKTKTAILSKM